MGTTFTGELTYLVVFLTSTSNYLLVISVFILGKTYKKTRKYDDDMLRYSKLHIYVSKLS